LTSVEPREQLGHAASVSLMRTAPIYKIRSCH
jgi:hypothetical protein